MAAQSASQALGLLISKDKAFGGIPYECFTKCYNNSDIHMLGRNLCSYRHTCTCGMCNPCRPRIALNTPYVTKYTTDKQTKNIQK